MTEKPTENQELDTAAITTTQASQGGSSEATDPELNEKGYALAGAIKKVFQSYALTVDGRDDMPCVNVGKQDLLEIAQICKTEVSLSMDMLHCLFAVDYEESIEINYILFSISHDRKMLIKTRVSAEDPQLDTVENVWSSANWFERETRDLFGVEFIGSVDTSPLLLYEGFEGNPGLRSFPLPDYEEW